MSSRRLGAFTAVSFCLAALPAAATDLVLKRVMLSAGGVAYIEREESPFERALALFGVSSTQALGLQVRLGLAPTGMPPSAAGL